MIEKINKNKIIKYNKWWKPPVQKLLAVKNNSWFNIQSLKDNKPELKESKINTSIMKCKMIKLNPTPEQHEILKSWLEIYRRVYNVTVKYFKKNKLCSKFNARKSIKPIINNNKNLANLIKKTKIPIHTVDNAIFDVIKAYDSCYSNYRSGNINHYRLRYKKITQPTKTLVLESCNFKQGAKGLKKKSLKDLNPSSPINTQHDVRLSFNGKTYILNIPEEKKTDQVFNRCNSCALDSGVRTFQTLYSPDGICFKFCSDTSKLKTIIDRIDNVKKFENNYENYLKRLRTRVKNFVNDLHWKTISFLCHNFNTIFLGNLSTKGIVSNNNSVLTKTTKRICYLLSHFTFRQRLEFKCKQFGCDFRVVDESYTSKTCSSCGEIKENLGGAKIYNCDKCKLEIDRDINGAKNILIKNI